MDEREAGSPGRARMRRTLGNVGRIALGIGGVMLLTVGLAAAQDKSAKRGEAVYAEQKCSLCHSIAGKGNTKGSLDGVGKKLSADEIRQWITNPKEMTTKTKAERKPPMKAYPNLPAADVDALVAYLETLK
jgi:mono/diheme cytochrome c family protein